MASHFFASIASPIMESIFVERRFYGHFDYVIGVSDHMFDRGNTSGGSGEPYYEEDAR